MSSTPYIIGVTGGSGAGKTTLLHKIKESCSGCDLTIVSMDDYYKPREMQKKDVGGIRIFDDPSCFHQGELYNDIIKLKKGETVTRREYTFNNPLATAATISYKPATVIIIEGLFIMHNEQIRNLLDIKIYLHVEQGLKVIRRIRRDAEERNYPLEDVLYRYQNHVLPAFKKYVEPYRHMADIIINNNSDMVNVSKILSVYIRHLSQ